MPFSFGADETSKDAAGLDVEILRAVMETAGCRFEFTQIEIPINRQMSAIRTGGLDLAFGVSKTPERERNGIFTDPYRSRSVGLFVRSGQVKKYKDIISINDLPNADMSIGIVRGYSYGILLDRILGQMTDKVFTASKSKLTRLMLIHRRFDGYLAYLPDESILINDNDLDHKITLHPMHLVNNKGIHFYLSSKSLDKETIDRINTSLIKIKTNGVYDRILEKYRLLYGIEKW